MLLINTGQVAKFIHIIAFFLFNAKNALDLSFFAFLALFSLLFPYFFMLKYSTVNMFCHFSLTKLTLLCSNTGFCGRSRDGNLRKACLRMPELLRKPEGIHWRCCSHIQSSSMVTPGLFILLLKLSPTPTLSAPCPVKSRLITFAICVCRGVFFYVV